MPLLDPIADPLDSRRAAHLLRRTTFGPTVQAINDFNGLPITTAINNLFDEAIPDPELPIDPQTGITWLTPSATGANSPQEDLMDYYMSWHLEQMRKGVTNIRERIVGKLTR